MGACIGRYFARGKEMAVSKRFNDYSNSFSMGTPICSSFAHKKLDDLSEESSGLAHLDFELAWPTPIIY
jgi:hypothetical protein